MMFVKTNHYKYVTTIQAHNPPINTPKLLKSLPHSNYVSVVQLASLRLQQVMRSVQFHYRLPVKHRGVLTMHCYCFRTEFCVQNILSDP